MMLIKLKWSAFAAVLLLVQCLSQAAERQEITPWKNLGTIGPGSSGGGNGLYGKPLESYSRDVVELPEFQQEVAPILLALKSKLPEFADELLKRAKRKVWYFVPVELFALPPQAIGVFFYSEQHALQSRRSIWVDDLIYSKNNYKERATLIVHEILMSIKLENFFGRGCPTDSMADRYGYCGIPQDDYDAVRNMTSILMNSIADKTSEEIREIVRDNGFGDYRVEKNEQIKPAKDLEQFYLMLLSEHLSRRLPNNSCAFDLKYDVAADRLRIAIYPSADGRVNEERIPAVIELASVPEFIAGTGNQPSQYIHVQKTRDAKLGDYRRKMTLSLTKDSIYGISVIWQQYVYDYRSGEMRWEDAQNGPKFSLAPGNLVCIRNKE